MKRLALLALGIALVYWFVLRPAPDDARATTATTATTATAPTLPATSPSTNNAHPATTHPTSAATPSPTPKSNFLKRPLDRTRDVLDANRKRLDQDF